MLILLSIGTLLIIDAVFLVLCMGLLLPLSKTRHAAFAVFKRNILGYFNNPLGYVFLCVFVLLGSLAAFWTPEFFSANLANLDQLNTWMPYILLVFIPTITMSIWAEERRQGTDELLLTMPASDWDIVVGKYLAAVGIFTVSLLVSQIANFIVLCSLALGEIDVGLFATTYLGYWVMGLAMLALGMVASFFTSNLTIGAILGMVFNAPFVFLQFIAARPWKFFSIGEQMFDFSRGVVSLRSLAFFGLLVAIGLYLSAVLIGRRHWSGGRDGQSMFGHYVVRSLALLATLFGLTFFLGQNLPLRLDATSAQISTLSDDTIRLLKELDGQKKVLIEAFISKEVPDEYAQTRSDLITKLNEFNAQGGKNLEIRIYDSIEPLSKEAAMAEDQFGITPVTVHVTERGEFRQDEVLLGAAFTCGVEKVVVPFFDRGTPVEYELIRSICTAARPTRPRLGILNTDARLFGSFDMQRMMPIPKQAIVTELEKQYEVVQIDPSSKITDKVDVLLAVQPSSLNQQQLDNFIEVVRQGVPTAIFEDPVPAMMNATGTGQPKMPPGGGMMGMGGPPEPKGNFQALTSVLGLEMYGSNAFGQFKPDVIWQNYNPYVKVRRLDHITREWVFIGDEMPDADNPLPADNPISSRLHQLLFLFPGGIKSTDQSGIHFVPLVKTSRQSGTVSDDILSQRRNPEMMDISRKILGEPVVIGAWVGSDPDKISMNGSSSRPADAKDSNSTTEDARGKKTSDPPAAPNNETKPESDKSKTNINVVFVADIDCLASDFLQVRAQPSREVQWQFDNVTFVLNILDVLAGDRSFVEIRKRQTRHSTLKLVEDQTSAASERAEEEIDQYNKDFDRAKGDAENAQKESLQKFQSVVDNLRKKQDEGVEEANQHETMRQLQTALQSLAIQTETLQRSTQIKIERLQRERDKGLKRINRELDQDIQAVQRRYKLLAVLIPPVPPLILGLTVFMNRRMRERESITEARRR